uniref:Uncharacterized protein n=1 Tax=Anguilla anguilla TaxID=7936 RepID=A0A0E9W513_ANGAN
MCKIRQFYFVSSFKALITRRTQGTGLDCQSIKDYFLSSLSRMFAVFYI